VGVLIWLVCVAGGRVWVDVVVTFGEVKVGTKLPEETLKICRDAGAGPLSA
jgi:hypothetical protein